jgi:chromosome segregation ATPase
MLRAHEDAQRSFEEALQRAGDREAAVHEAHRASLRELDAVNERFRAASCRIEVLLEDQRALTTQSAERMATVEKLEGELQSLRNRVAELEENRVDLLKHLEELAIPARRYFKLRGLFPEPLRRIGRKGLQVVRQMKGK